MTHEPSSIAPGKDRLGVGIASILLAVLFFAIVDATAKWLGRDYEPAQIVFLRYAFGLLPVAAFVWRGGGLSALRTRRPGLHALRALLVFVALFTFFSGLRRMPLAEAIAIAFTAPLFITALSAPLLAEPVGARRWVAVLIGFMGALVMVRPGAAGFRVEALWILAAALSFALAMLLTRRMTRSETNIAMLAYTTLGAGLAGLPLMPFVWRPPAGGDIWLFLLIGMVGGTAAYFVIAAYRHAPAALVAPFEYTALVWGAILGWILWREQPEPLVWTGAAIIMLSGLYITHREAAAAARAGA
ncbi:MAG: DMT family transporter [Rhodospirillales bacterium]|nr:DMT family transporter [Rhodospirillales bacterium]MDH3911451.1 DMT family transporter [Rhodospirillales bacterium]MDH3917918.1 DMT family transporter [Rhodospirillales bacterium]MDH3969001.1 DMT family transporter [Rhodospirillales bacterium]